MRVHHLNCATLCPPVAKLVNGEGGLFHAGKMVCHCLLVESDDGLVLVDTGLGLGDLEAPRARLGRGFLAITRPLLDKAETARHQVERLGFQQSDVRHIVVTHLDLDHAGALSDFPEAAIHVTKAEHEAAMTPRTLLERHRYRAAHWAHGPRWVTHEPHGESWQGFSSVRALVDKGNLNTEILLVPLHGHTRGHAAVAVRASDGWLLHAGDAYFHHGEIHGEHRFCPAGLAAFQKLVAIDDEARRANQERLRALARDTAGSVRIFSAHDPVELQQFMA